MPEQNTQQDLREILQIRRDKLKALQDAGMNPFEITRYDVTHHAQEVKDNFDALEGQTVSLGGRLMSKRGMGKVSFCDLQDKSGRIQIYARRDEMDEEAYNRFKKYDIGDIVGVKGEVFRTQKGEMSVRATRDHPAGQVPAAPAREVPRPHRQGAALPPAVCGPDHEPRDASGTFEIRSKFVGLPAPLSGQPGLYGGGDPRAQPHCRRRQRPALHHPPQHPGHRHVYAHRHGAAPEAADRGRYGARV